MSLFNWFSGKATVPKAPSDKDSRSRIRLGRGSPTATRDKTKPSEADRLAVDSTCSSEQRKLQRHARREQLYRAVREAFTHAGVLSATYRFKVLSLDQSGKQFMVMVDIEPSFDHRAQTLAAIEARVAQTAKTRYEIRVTSVYWRIATALAAQGKTTTPAQARVAAAHDPETVKSDARKLPTGRYDPIQDGELVAFKQALMTASANGSVVADLASKARIGLHSYTLLTGFEDTEMAEPESMPALSATQYGDLI